MLLILGLLTLLGLLVRLPSFNDSLFADEISTHFIVVGHGLGRVLQLVRSNQETSPPLYFLAAWATKGLLASPSQSIRLVSLVAGVAAIPLTYLLGIWTVGRRAALVGATCVALSPFLILYSTEARAYMLVLFLALLSTLAMLRALDTRRTGWWVAYAVCSCAAVYTHYTVVFLLVAQFGWAFWTQPRARRSLIVANAAAALAFLPWVGALREDFAAPVFLEPFSLNGLWVALQRVWVGHPYLPIEFMPGRKTLLLAAAGLAVGLVGLIIRARSAGRSQWRLPPRTALVVVLATVPVVLVVLDSAVGTSILVPRNLIACWPGLALSIAVLVTSPTRLLRVIAVTLTLGAFAIGAAKMLDSSAQRPSAAAAVEFIDRFARPGDPIVSYPFFSHPLSELDVALGEAGSSTSHPVIRLNNPTLESELQALSGPDPQPNYALPVASPEDVARQAAARATNGKIFLVSTANVSRLVANSPESPVSRFVKALPRRFRVADHASFPGYTPFYDESVWVFRDAGATRKP